MNHLLPIIRRVRRPLVVKDTPPVMAGNAEPVELTAETQRRGAGEEEPGNVEPRTLNDVNAADKRSAQ